MVVTLRCSGTSQSVRSINQIPSPPTAEAAYNNSPIPSHRITHLRALTYPTFHICTCTCTCIFLTHQQSLHRPPAITQQCCTNTSSLVDTIYQSSLLFCVSSRPSLWPESLHVDRPHSESCIHCRADVDGTNDHPAARPDFYHAFVLIMTLVTRKRSLVDMQSSTGAASAEYNDYDYVREVLQLDVGKTESVLDESLVQEAENLGITISRPPTPTNNHETHMSMSNSAITVASHHARTTSSSSKESASTGMTSRSSNEQFDNSTLPQTRKRSSARRNLSFSEYEKYLAQQDAQDPNKQSVPPAIPAEPAPSLFSVSTRKSYYSIKSNFSRRFRLRRNKTSQEDTR